MTTAYATHPQFAEHRLPGQMHPERPERIKAVWEQMQASELVSRLHTIEAEPIDEDLILGVHSPYHLERLRRTSEQIRLSMLDADTYALPDSYRIARIAANSAVQVVDAVLSGQARNGLAAVRPPGHHATPDQAMGFCLLNNIAIAARYASHRAPRILIADYDVHHGNGTQDIFYTDENVLFISTHQYPFYPGSGSIDETGSGDGLGTTINIPLPAGCGDQVYRDVYEQVVWPAAERFRPDLILVSAGFDAHWADPLAMMALTLSGYDHLTRQLIAMAEALCNGRIVFLMEGGYNLNAIGHGMRNIAHALLGDEGISDPFDNSRAQASITDSSALLDEIRDLHSL